MAISEKELRDLKKDINRSLDKNDTRRVNGHNVVFRQMEAQLILVAGLFLALSAQFSDNLSSSSTAVKVLAILIIIFLNFSILLGILQHFMEASYFKKSALGYREIRNNLDVDNPESVAQFKGATEQFSLMQGNSVKRWPTYTQMALLAIAVVLISVVSGLKILGQ